ncbi:MAG: hydroxyethylthiazole kinase [Coprobacillaceae bacterium]
MKETYLKNLKEQKPVIHNITNYVTVNDCANIILACGASPIMADAIEEVEEITTICNGLHLNIGTPNPNNIEAMILAGKRANQLKHPVLLDPVGVGASKLRTDAAVRLVKELDIQVIRGNISEIKTLALGTNTVQGVDASIDDVVTKDNIKETVGFIKKFANETKAIIVVTGAIDIVANSEKAYVIYNGHEMMSRVTGTGCMLSAITTSYIAANNDALLEATTTAVIAMGICGEVAFERLSSHDGNSSYRNYIIDAMYHIDQNQLEKRSKYDIY